MKQKSISISREVLSKRAMKRKLAHPAIKTEIDVKLENESFNDLKGYIYDKITKER